jgi:hypothetical protein
MKLTPTVLVHFDILLNTWHTPDYESVPPHPLLWMKPLTRRNARTVVPRQDGEDRCNPIISWSSVHRKYSP